jgi:hypothetical protein
MPCDECSPDFDCWRAAMDCCRKVQRPLPQRGTRPKETDTPTAKIEVSLATPNLPNFIRDHLSGQMIDVANLDAATVEIVATKWTEAFRKHVADRKKKQAQT